MNRAHRGLAVAGLVAVVASATLLCGGLGMAASGLTTVPSNFGTKATIDRLEAEIRARGIQTRHRGKTFRARRLIAQKVPDRSLHQRRGGNRRRECLG